jgi:ubiquinone biosynthesis monooxygenase Coq7
MTSRTISPSARLNAGESLGSRILKVNHAGENGAVCIYAGQIAVARFTAPGLVPELREFISHERRHRETFFRELQQRGVRRCRSYLLCGAGGFVLGFLTGLCGRGAICATTVAVESVVLRHLEQQLAALEGKDASAVAAIASIVEEEKQHHDKSARQATGSLWEKILTPVVAMSTESVIWAGMHL